jgi:hypothetical protein
MYIKFMYKLNLRGKFITYLAQLILDRQSDSGDRQSRNAPK